MAEWYWEKTFSNRIWECPKGSRFIEYEESDREWMEPLGIGVISLYMVRPMVRISHGDLFGE